MALEQINQAVLSSAEAEADLVLKAANKSADEKIASAKRTAEQEGERRYQAAVRSIEEEFARKLIQIQGTINKELLVRKNALLHKVFAQVRERILALPVPQYSAVMIKLLQQSAEGRGGALCIHPSEKDVFEAMLSSFNADRAEDMKVHVDDSHMLQERGGFIFLSDTFQVDQTLGTLLSDMEYSLVPKIAAAIFAEQQ